MTRKSQGIGDKRTLEQYSECEKVRASQEASVWKSSLRILGIALPAIFRTEGAHVSKCAPPTTRLLPSARRRHKRSNSQRKTCHSPPLRILCFYLAFARTRKGKRLNEAYTSPVMSCPDYSDLKHDSSRKQQRKDLHDQEKITNRSIKTTENADLCSDTLSFLIPPRTSIKTPITHHASVVLERQCVRCHPIEEVTVVANNHRASRESVDSLLQSSQGVNV